MFIDMSNFSKTNIVPRTALSLSSLCHYEKKQKTVIVKHNNLKQWLIDKVINGYMEINM